MNLIKAYYVINTVDKIVIPLGVSNEHDFIVIFKRAPGQGQRGSFQYFVVNLKESQSKIEIDNSLLLKYLNK
jgi:hypothetical protein